jgi:hypothetical protein
LLQGRLQERAALIEGLSLAAIEYLAWRGGLGKIVQFGNEGNGPFDSEAFGIGSIGKRSCRHGKPSSLEKNQGGLVAVTNAEIERHTRDTAPGSELDA